MKYALNNSLKNITRLFFYFSYFSFVYVVVFFLLYRVWESPRNRFSGLISFSPPVRPLSLKLNLHRPNTPKELTVLCKL
jgi:hypothetical protein